MDNLDGYEDDDEDEALARKLQKQYEEENLRYKKQKNMGTKNRNTRNLRKRSPIKYDDGSDDNEKKIKAEMEDGGPDSPYSEDTLWNYDKKSMKYDSSEEAISSSESDSSNDKFEDDREIQQQKIPCKYGINCWRVNPDHLRQFSHPPR